MRIYVHTKTCTQLFTAPLFTIAKQWEQLRYPPTGEWTNRKWYVHTMEYYSAIKGIFTLHGGTLKTLCYMKKVSHKRPHII